MKTSKLISGVHSNATAIHPRRFSGPDISHWEMDIVVLRDVGLRQTHRFTVTEGTWKCNFLAVQEFRRIEERMEGKVELIEEVGKTEFNYWHFPSRAVLVTAPMRQRHRLTVIPNDPILADHCLTGTMPVAWFNLRPVAQTVQQTQPNCRVRHGESRLVLA
ncbi:hypothetical protein RRG08_064142 [Elysia crispata]|uniref:Uncharacterized protein n=1 Tax=Elysia crispata TaxID=231223 RepID=A0AAE0ZLX7_9GAST|nr:hypothetical protein RRG08_064142 [Elysia crispata]